MAFRSRDIRDRREGERSKRRHSNFRGISDRLAALVGETTETSRVKETRGEGDSRAGNPARSRALLYELALVIFPEFIFLPLVDGNLLTRPRVSLFRHYL